MEQGRGWRDVWERWALPVALVGVVVAGAVTASTFLADPPTVPAVVKVLLFLGIFPLHLGTIFVLRESGEAPTDALRRLPPLVLAVAAAMFMAFALAGMTAVLGKSGATERHDGRYFLNDHGEISEITKDDYEQRRAGSARSSAAIPGAFYVAGAAVALLARAESKLAGGTDPER
jgi:hypothetical protein